jgi:hypothetical protein
MDRFVIMDALRFHLCLDVALDLLDPSSAATLPAI